MSNSLSDPTIELEAIMGQLETLLGASQVTDEDVAAIMKQIASERPDTEASTPVEPLYPDRQGGDNVPAPRPSTGPTSEAGKARSAQNSFKHGLAAGFSHFKLLPGESPAEYAELVSEVRAQFVPRTTAERHKIDDMAQAWWLQRRARNLQTSAIESGDDKAFALYLRYETTQRRSYQMAYKDFEDMKKHRLADAKSPDLTPISQATTFQSQREYPSQSNRQPASEVPADRPLAA